MEPILLIDGTEAGDLSNLKPQVSEYSFAQLRELGLKIYKEVWKQFYEWELREYQLLDLGALQDSEMQIDSKNPNKPSLVVSQYDAEGRSISYPLEMEEIFVDPTFEAHPPYESCPPVNQSVRFVVHETAAFIPYGDEENFPVMEYLDQFQSFAWEKDFDPDSEMIQIETVRRLTNEYKMSIRQIGRICIFPGPLRGTYNEGLLWERFQRDFLRWPGGTEDDIEEACVEPAVDDLCARLTSVLATFCPNLNCLRTLCTTHSHPQSGSFGGGRPQVTNQSMRLSEGWPCGEECFRLTDESFVLADLCFKPCREVFVQRSSIFPDHMVYDDGPADMRNNKTKRKAQKPRLIFEEKNDHSIFVPLEPCNHKGPCEKERCECSRRKRHCQLACRCGTRCDRQYRGCECKRCTINCPCIENSRECLPGICEKCDARGATDHPCANTRLQRNDAKAVEIRRAKYGLGAFATQDMEPDDFIGDYVGRMLTTNDIEILDPVIKYNGRNYFFEFSKENVDEMLDAGPIGNATRFLNHTTAETGQLFLLVNGEHHIGFYTTKAVACGEELFLYYGPTYWLADSSD
ncbi:hypothetical protein EDD22DRAFT_905831 [Suillus occidentalis]|nr:hypothetical protein EDD22DRAFT_905831 [Suillus occidentalis]